MRVPRAGEHGYPQNFYTMRKSLTKTSKFLSYILRHAPETINLSLDAQGWALVDDLIIKAKANGNELDLGTLKQVVEINDKNRFSFSDDGKKIRANQGHSLIIDLGLISMEPPEILYHGTTVRFLDSIWKTGLSRGRRTHVHLSSDVHTAVKVGSRHGKPVVLRINSAKMQKSGYKFFLSKNKVWLTDHVPPAFISFDDKNGEK